MQVINFCRNYYLVWTVLSERVCRKVYHCLKDNSTDHTLRKITENNIC